MNRFIEKLKTTVNPFSQFLLLLGVDLTITLYIFAAAVKAYSVAFSVYLYPLQVMRTSLELAPAMFATCVSCAVICELYTQDLKNKK